MATNLREQKENIIKDIKKILERSIKPNEGSLWVYGSSGYSLGFKVGLGFVYPKDEVTAEAIIPALDSDSGETEKLTAKAKTPRVALKRLLKLVQAL